MKRKKKKGHKLRRKFAQPDYSSSQTARTVGKVVVVVAAGMLAVACFV